MVEEIQEIDEKLLTGKYLLIGHITPEYEGIGYTISVDFRSYCSKYKITVEKFRNDGGFGQDISRDEHFFETMSEIVRKVEVYGLSLLDFDIIPVKLG